MRFLMPLLTLAPSLILFISTPSFACSSPGKLLLVTGDSSSSLEGCPQASLDAGRTLQNAIAVTSQPPTRESLEKLFTITKVAQRIDAQYAAMVPFITKFLNKSMAFGSENTEANKIFDEVFSKEMKLLRAELGWSALKEDYVKLYSSTFSQAEIDGLIAFYESSTGKSYLEKLPAITEKSRAITEQRLELLIPKLKQISEDSVKKFRNQPDVKKP